MTKINSPVDTKCIAFITGTRADFGKIQPLAIASASAGFRVVYFVTGMHMLRRYGDTRLEVRAEAVGDVYEFINQTPSDNHDTVLAKTMSGFADWVNEHPPALVIIHGDRVEALSVALVCAMRYIPCAHIEGGEVSGTIDEIYRHCNTKLCRYHFVSSNTAADRILALGEHPDDTFVIGSPELDCHGAPPEVSMDEVRKRYEIEFNSYGIAILHPVTSELESIHEQASRLFSLLELSKRQFVVICPNNDPGSEEIFSVISSLPSSQFRVIPSMRFSYFSVLMRNASVIVGNSSLGVREAPFFGVPSLNIGTRQKNRASEKSITHASANDVDVISKFLRDRWGEKFESSRNFGTGDAGEKFVSIISSPEFWIRPRQKLFYELR